MTKEHDTTGTEQTGALTDTERIRIARDATNRALDKFPAARCWRDDVEGDALLGVVSAERSHEAGLGGVRRRATSLAYWAALKSAKRATCWEGERAGRCDRARVYAETRRLDRISRGDLDQRETVNEDKMDRRPPLAGLEMTEHAEGLAEAMHALSDIQRGIVHDRHHRSLSLRTIALQHGVSVTTVHRWLGEAYAVLATKLREIAARRGETGETGTPHPPERGTPTGAPHNVSSPTT